jgi:hypothetical protein
MEDASKTVRRVAILKKVDLAPLADGWDGCYLNVTPATYPEMKEFKNLDPEGMTDEQGLDLMLELIKRHFVNGKIMVADDKGNVTLGDAQKDDIDQFSVEMNNAVFEVIIGQKFDPKALAQQRGNPTPPSLPPSEPKSENSAAPTETPSSETAKQ